MSLTSDELQKIEDTINEARLNVQQQQVAGIQQQVAQQQQEKDKGMVKEQLDLAEEIAMIEHLLRGHYIKRDINTGISRWTVPEDNDLVLFTEYGINVILSYVQWYLNKNTLLSNYDEDVINQKMLDISNTINDRIFMEYDKIFLEPTNEECKEEVKNRIKKKVDLKKFSMEVMDIEVTEEKEKEFREQVMKEMEGRIERELQVVKEQKRKNKLKSFESIIRTIQDSIHSTYNRAYKGMERSSLRKHVTISETRGAMLNPPPQTGILDRFRKR